jgi:hypothetical protein
MPMKKIAATFVLCFIVGTIGIALGGLVSKPFTFSPSTLAKSSEVNSNFDTLYNEFNGNISDANISSIAAIQQSKINNLVADLAARLSDAGDTITGPLIAKFSAPYFRLIGTEASAKDFRLVESAGVVILQRNDGTELAPSWVTVFQFKSTGTPTEASDVARKDYVDGLTSGLAVSRTVKTDADFAINSTSMTDVSGLSAAVATGARRARVSFTGTVVNNTGSGRGYGVQVVVDGVLIPGGLVRASPGSGNDTNMSFSAVTDVLSAASHTFKVQVQTTNAAGSQSLYANAATPAALIVEELAQ